MAIRAVGTAGERAAVAGASAAGGIAGGIATATVISILKEINDRVAKMQRDMEEASPAFKGMEDIMDRQFKLVLKPMGDFMSLIMRPYIILMMQRLREGMTEITAIRARAAIAGTPEEEVMAEIGEVIKDMAKDMYTTAHEMKLIISPMSAELDGYIAGLKAVRTTFVTNLQSWNTGFSEAMDLAGTELKDSIEESAKNVFGGILRGIGDVWDNLMSGGAGMYVERTTGLGMSAEHRPGWGWAGPFETMEDVEAYLKSAGLAD